MRRHRFVIGGLALFAALSMSACGVGQRQSPAASDEETGHTRVAQADDEKPATYTTKAGDTLQGVAARPDIYGEPGLWPLIQDANQESVGKKSATQKLKADLVLEIPRNSDADTLAAARAKAQEAAAAAKTLAASRSQKQSHKASAKGAAEQASAASTSSGSGAGQAKATAKPAPVAVAKSAPTPAVVAAAVPAAAPAPAPKHHTKLLPLFFLLLLVLAALGAVLYVFSKRDRQDLD